MKQQIYRKRWPIIILAGIPGLFGFATMKAEKLAPNVAVEASIERGSSVSYEVPLHAGEFFHLKVETVLQQPNVIATVITPANEQLMEASNFTFSSFELAFVAKMDGTYRLQIQPRQIGASAQFRLIMDSPRAATPTDEEAANASLALHKANHWFIQLSVSPPTEALLLSAIASYREALKLLKGLDDREAEASAFQHLGTSYLAHKDFDDAVESFASAATTWRSLGNRNYEVAAQLAGIEANRQRGHYGEAVAASKDLIDGARAKGDAAGQNIALKTLYSVYNSAEDPEGAIESQQQLLKLEPNQNTENAAGYFVNIATRYLVLHQQRTSIDYRKNAASIYERLGLRKPLAAQLGRIALGYSLLGETQPASESYDRAVSLDPFQIDPVLLARLGRTAQAIPTFQEEIARLHEQKSPLEGQSLLQLAGVYADTKQQTLAVEYLAKAVAAWPVNQSPDLRIEFLAGVARSYEDLGEPAAALKLFQEYLLAVRAKGVDGFPQYPGFLAEMARSERDLGRLDQAREHLATALEVREERRSRIASPELAASYFSQSRFIFEVYIDVLMRQGGHEAEAFEASERARAHALISNLSDTISKVREGVDPQLVKQERDLRSRINEVAIQQFIATGAGKTQPNPYKIGELTAELNILKGRIRSSSPAYASLTEPAALKLSEIRTKVLEPGTTLLEFSLSDVATSYVWEVTSDSLRSAPLRSRSEIDAAARRVREALLAQEKKQSRSLNTARDLTVATEALSKLVLGPLGSIHPGKRLLIVSDGILDFVPFAMLLDPKTNFPLIASYEIVGIPSGSTLATMREVTTPRRHDPRLEIAILADPVFSAQDERLAVTYRSTVPVVPEILARSISETGMALPRLAFTHQEATSIQNAAPRGSTILKTGVDANRNFVASGAIGDYRIVHFATHGLLNTKEPTLSGIVLSLVDKQGKPQDGFLRLHDIYNLRLNADLVVLSACQTALGNQVQGEGAMSLSRGFFYAGAARVLASLWTVDDRATAELMRNFYSNMLSNKSNKMSPAAALREAQMQMRKSPQWSNPYYWAGFELQGEWK